MNIWIITFMFKQRGWTQEWMHELYDAVYDIGIKHSIDEGSWWFMNNVWKTWESNTKPMIWSLLFFDQKEGFLHFLFYWEFQFIFHFIQQFIDDHDFFSFLPPFPSPNTLRSCSMLKHHLLATWIGSTRANSFFSVVFYVLLWRICDCDDTEGS